LSATGNTIDVSAEQVWFDSDGLRLAGIIETGGESIERRPAVILLHGFGANKSDGVVKLTAAMLTRLGYLTLRFDMRGCGESEGVPGRVLCEEQVRDVRNCVTYLRTLPGVDAERIAVLGHSFGAAVAVYAAAVDERIAACISSAGWGDGTAKLRQQHRGEAAWTKFMAMVERGRASLLAGQPMNVSRFDIVPIPEHLRAGLPPGSYMEFPFEVVESMLAFRPNEVVARIAPRPLLLLHPASDAVTPSEQSIELFRHASMPADLHLFAGIDHFIFSDDNTMVLDLLKGWLRRYLPAEQRDVVVSQERAATCP
jgi:alpha-beta hydrolase superfamily lysophospholipase